MFDRILIPLDGSPFAEEIIPYALGLAESAQAGLTLLRVVEHESGLAAAQVYVSGLARFLGAKGNVTVAHAGPASAILEELGRQPRSLVAMTTHGHSGLLEAVLGSVAVGVVQDSPRPVLIYRPRGRADALDIDRKVEITTIVAPIDGSDFSERMLTYAAEIAGAIKANLTLVQVLPEGSRKPPEMPPGDVLESSYVRNWAEKIREAHGINAGWEVLHGEPADAICRHLNGRNDVMLAMSSHARAGLKETVFGSVTRECVRCAGVPILVYRPSR